MQHNGSDPDLLAKMRKDFAQELISYLEESEDLFFQSKSPEIQPLFHGSVSTLNFDHWDTIARKMQDCIAAFNANPSQVTPETLTLLIQITDHLKNQLKHQLEDLI